MNSPFLTMDAQEPPEAVVAAASAPREVATKPAKIVKPVIVANTVNPKFRYVASSSEVRSVAQANNESAERPRQ